MVATGLFCQQLLGVQPSHRRMQESIQHIQRKMPSEKQGDFYYWYYACLSLYQNQGPAWDEWNERMKPIWLNLQVKTGKDAGSWDARGGRHMSDMGRVITTALATLSSRSITATCHYIRSGQLHSQCRINDGRV